MCAWIPRGRIILSDVRYWHMKATHELLWVGENTLHQLVGTASL